MTIERWTDAMLDQLASTTAQTSRDIAALQVSTTELRISTTELRTTVQNLAATTAQHAGEISDLRGTQELFAENLRFLSEQQALDRAEYRTYFDELRTYVRDSRADFLQVQAEIRAMQAEIRGLQTENRRILEWLERRDQP